MSSKRYTAEFKSDAVGQVVDRGYSVPSVSKRLGVSDHSLRITSGSGSQVKAVMIAPWMIWMRFVARTPV